MNTEIKVLDHGYARLVSYTLLFTEVGWRRWLNRECAMSTWQVDDEKPPKFPCYAFATPDVGKLMPVYLSPADVMRMATEITEAVHAARGHRESTNSSGT